MYSTHFEFGDGHALFLNSSLVFSGPIHAGVPPADLRLRCHASLSTLLLAAADGRVESTCDVFRGDSMGDAATRSEQLDCLGVQVGAAARDHSEQCEWTLFTESVGTLLSMSMGFWGAVVIL